jgi:glutaconate CoA-transferase subunit B
MSKRLLAIMNHEPHRLVEKVGYITSPGWLEGGETRRQAGLKHGGTSAVITDLAILRPFGPERELRLASVHPGHTIEEVKAKTGWALKTFPDAGMTPEPTSQEMEALHKIDTEGFWRS